MRNKGKAKEVLKNRIQKPTKFVGFYKSEAQSQIENQSRRDLSLFASALLSKLVCQSVPKCAEVCQSVPKCDAGSKLSISVSLRLTGS